MNILVLSGVIPAPIESKKRENDVLITTAKLHQQVNKNIKYSFVFIVPYSSFIFSKLSRKWKQYKDLIDMKSYDYEGFNIEVIAVPGFRNDRWIKTLFINIGYILYKKKLKSIVIKNNIDIVHAHNISIDAGIAYKINKEFKIPYVITSRGLGRASLSYSVKNYIKKASAIVNLGQNQNEISKTFNSNSYLIPHGIDKRFIEAKKFHFNNTQPLRIVTVSRLLDWKNIDKVIHALNSIKIDFTYDIYGDGPHMSQLKQIVNNLNLNDKITFKGYVAYEQISLILLEYDIFALPSYIETFGRVYIEAMACSLPIIAAKGGGIEDYIVNGEEGFLIDHDKPEQLQKVLLKFDMDKSLIQTMGLKAKNTSNLFSWDKIISNLNEVYKSVY